MSDMRGTWYVVPTPFRPDGSLDLESQRRLVGASIHWGIDGLTVMGVMSEAAALSDEERSRALEAIFEASAGRVPVAVGCSGASVSRVRDLISQARSLGAVAAMVSAPPLMRNTDLLPEFYARVAGDLPIVVQDEPNATGVTMPVSTLLRCLDACSSDTVKLEDPPTPQKISRLLSQRPGLRVFGGLGGVAALSELGRGACGTMTGFAYPEVLAAVRIAVERGELDRAARVFDRYLPLIQFEGQPMVGLAIRKEVLRRRGAIECAATRGLASGLDPATMGELDHLLARLGIAPSLEPLAVEA